MGLDLVEFTIVVEDAFRLSIPDAEAAEITTPGKLVNYLEARLGSAVGSVCFEQRAFYALRRAAIDVLGSPRVKIRPDTRWHSCIPYGDRRRAWNALRHAVGVSTWPSLSWWGALPRPFSTIGATADYLATYAPGDFKHPLATWSRQEIQRTVQRLMAAEFGIDEFNWTDRFVDDLGLD